MASPQIIVVEMLMISLEANNIYPLTSSLWKNMRDRWRSQSSPLTFHHVLQMKYKPSREVPCFGTSFHCPAGRLRQRQNPRYIAFDRKVSNLRSCQGSELADDEAF